jgi:hypothetical protein
MTFSPILQNANQKYRKGFIMHCIKRYYRLLWGAIIVLSSQFIFIPTDNFAKSNGPEVLVEQLHQVNMTKPILYSTVGMVTLSYTPEPNSYFINMVALDKDEKPQWIIRNLYIPDNSWITTDQSISARFCLQSLGFVTGDVVGTLNLYGHISETVLSEMPIPGEFTPMEVDTLMDDAQGDFTEIPPSVPPVVDQPKFPEFTPTDQIAPVAFRGCGVPNIDLDDKTYPDNETYAGDRNACGPASAANSLKWLDDIYAEIDIPDLRTIMNELSALMNRPRNGGVTISNFIQGKLDFIEAHALQINVKFQSSYDSKDVISSSGKTFARNENTGKAGFYPTWNWLKQQMADGEDVEIMYYWYDDEVWRGHAVVVTGIEESQDGSKKSVKFKHDVLQGRSGGIKQEDESIYIDSYGRMVLRSRGAFIGNVVAESPGVPYPTPVELGLLTAEVVNSNVHLIWKTESESNNYGFNIFRNNERITFVEGNGTTLEPQTYSYVDAGLSDGTYHYELIQIDFDGTQKKVGSVNIVVLNNPTEFILSQNYPNPFNATTKIKYTIPENGFVSIKIYNLLGTEVATLVNEEKETGVYTIDFDASHLVNGIYFYRMEVSGFNQMKKFLLLK